MTILRSRFLRLSLLFAALLFIAGCSSSETEDAVDDATDTIEDAADDAADAMGDAMDN